MVTSTLKRQSSSNLFFLPNPHVFQSNLDQIFSRLETTPRTRKESSSPGNKPQLIPKVADQAANKRSRILCLVMHLRKGTASTSLMGGLKKESENWQEINPSFTFPYWAQQPLRVSSLEVLKSSERPFWTIPWRIWLFPMTNMPDGFSFRLWVFSSLTEQSFKIHLYTSSQ